MRMKAIGMVALLALSLAACTSGGGVETEIITPTVALLGDGPALEAAPPETSESIHSDETGDAYPPAATTDPADSGYPAMPEEQAPPTAYPDTTAGVPPTEIDPASLTPVVGEVVTPSAQQTQLVEASARDLTVQTDVPLDEIELLSAMNVVWPNAALGCPEEGMNYAEVQVEGMLITLGAGGQEYTYHTDGSNNYVFCRDGARISSGIIP